MSDTTKAAQEDDEKRGGVYVAGLIDRDTRVKSWKDYLIPALAGGIVMLLATIAINFGSTVYSGENRSAAVLTERIAGIAEDVKEQKRLTQDILMKASDLYTRREAQADREAAERRFQSMEGRLADVTRRLETMETAQRFMQNSLIERGSAKDKR